MQNRIRYRVLGFLIVLSVITYMDRVCISVASGRIQEEFGISIKGWGWVMGAFTLAYGAFEIPSGAYGDRFGQRRVLTRIVVWWSVFTACTGMTFNYLGLLVTRFLFGMGEAGAYPNATGSIRHWFPRAERARAQGFVWGASRIGGALTPVVVVPLLQVFGWRTVFYLFAAVGMVWACFWWVWYRDRPAEMSSVTSDELAEIGQDDTTHGYHHLVWTQFGRNQQLWLIVAMYAFYAWGSTFFIVYLPNFLMKGRGLTESTMAFFASVPFFMGALGNLVGGYLSDNWTRRYGSKVGRTALGATCLLCTSLLLLMTAMARDTNVAIVYLSLSFGIMDCMLPCAWAICLDIGGKHSGAVSGAMNTAGQAGAFICSVLFGHFVEWFGNYDAPLVVIASMVFVSSLLFSQIDPTRPLIFESGASPAEETECV